MKVNNQQPELNGLLTFYKGPEAVPDDVILSFGDDEEEALKSAVVWAWQHRQVTRMSQRRGSELIGITNSHFSNILSKDKHLGIHKLPAFEWVVGNTAVTQTKQRFDALRKSVAFEKVGQMVAAHLMQQQAA